MVRMRPSGQVYSLWALILSGVIPGGSRRVVGMREVVEKFCPAKAINSRWDLLGFHSEALDNLQGNPSVQQQSDSTPKPRLPLTGDPFITVRDQPDSHRPQISLCPQVMPSSHLPFPTSLSASQKLIPVQ